MTDQQQTFQSKLHFNNRRPMFASGDQRIVVTAPRFSPDGARVSLLGQHRSPAAFAPSMGKGSTVLGAVGTSGTGPTGRGYEP